MGTDLHNEEHTPKPPNSSGLTVDVTQWGPDAGTIERIRCRVFEHPVVEKYLTGTRYRLLSIEPLEIEEKTDEPVSADRYRATVYDYTNNRTVFIDVSGAESDHIVVSDSSIQPLPNQEEFQEALNILMAHEELGRAFEDQQVQPYYAMPPLVTQDVELPDGQIPRTLAVGLLPNNDRFQHEIVGV